MGSYLAIRWGRGVPRLALLVAAARPGAGDVRPPRPPWNLLLIPVGGLSPAGQPGLDVRLQRRRGSGRGGRVGLLALPLILLLPSVAADLAVAGLLVLGVYGVAIALLWPRVVPQYQDLLYGAVWVTNRQLAVLAACRGWP